MGRVGRLIQILNLQALASQDQREMEQALPALQRALSLAEPEGYVRTFIDEGEPMARLLRRALGQGIMPSYVGRLLAALGDVTKAKLSSSVLSPGSGQALRPSSPLVEPLTAREHEVLCLIAAGLSNQEIAQDLVIALSTVKSHINHIYGKLDVESRTQAVVKAQELSLL